MTSVWGHYHGWVIFLYYIAGFAGVFMLAHPFLLVFIFALFTINEWVFSYERKDRIKHMLKMFISKIILFILTVTINALLNHRGPTIIMSISNFRITKESICYGIYMALVIITCISLFRQFSSAMSDEKILAILAGKLPGLALVFSMILGLVPYARIKSIRLKQINMTQSDEHGIKRLMFRTGLYGTLFTMLLEDGIIRSISMNDRGYGTSKRSSFYKRKLILSDVIMIILICLFITGCVFIRIYDPVYARYFPTMKIDDISIYIYIMCTAYYALPVFINIFIDQHIKHRINDSL